jgi:hypothetical protein
MKNLITGLFALGIALSSTGCVFRHVTRFEDNQKAPLTALEMDKTTSYIVMAKTVHQFYLCQDTGEKLVCKLSCDGTNDVVCPAAQVNGNMTTTNVR